MEKEETFFIFQTLKEISGTSESEKVYLATTIKDGKSELVISKTITERYPVQDYNKVMDLFERLSCGAGRKVFTLEELAHHFNPHK